MDISTLFYNILNLLLRTQQILDFSKYFKIPNRVELWDNNHKRGSKGRVGGEHDREAENRKLGYIGTVKL
jgi:hypothetical protein